MDKWTNGILQWALGSLESDDDFSQIDMDDALSGATPKDVAQITIECTIAILDAARANRIAKSVAAYIPLPPKKRLKIDCPSLPELLSKDWKFGPGRSVPGIYITRPGLVYEIETGEEYRRILEDSAIRDDFTVWYSTFRHELEMTQGFEFSRGIWVHSRD